MSAGGAGDSGEGDGDRDRGRGNACWSCPPLLRVSWQDHEDPDVSSSATAPGGDPEEEPAPRPAGDGDPTVTPALCHNRDPSIPLSLCCEGDPNNIHPSLTHICPLLVPYCDPLFPQVFGAVLNINRGNPGQYEVLVDKWPEFGAVLARPSGEVANGDMGDCRRGVTQCPGTCQVCSELPWVPPGAGE